MTRRTRVLTVGNNEVLQVEAGGNISMDGAFLPRIVAITQSDYDALSPPRSDTLYLVID